MREDVARLIEASSPYKRSKFRVTKRSTPKERMRHRLYYRKNKTKIKLRRKLYRMRNKSHSRLRKSMHQTTTLRHHSKTYRPKKLHPGLHRHLPRPHTTGFPVRRLNLGGGARHA